MAMSSSERKGFDKKVLLKGEWRLQSWTCIGMEYGISENYAKHFYHYLCGYAHSGGNSVMQVGQAQNIEIQKELMNMSFSIILISMAMYAEVLLKLVKETGNAADIEFTALEEEYWKYFLLLARYKRTDESDNQKVDKEVRP